VNRHVTMDEVAQMRPLAMLPMDEGQWSLVYPIGLDLEAGALAIGRIFDYPCSPQ
jgi:hypothetical protein